MLTVSIASTVLFLLVLAGPSLRQLKRGARRPLLVTMLLIGISASLSAALAWTFWHILATGSNEQKVIAIEDETIPALEPPAETSPIPAIAIQAPPTVRLDETAKTPQPTSQQPKTQMGSADKLDLSKLEKELAEHNRLENARLQPRFRFVLGQAQQDENISTLEIWNDGTEVQSFWVRQYSFLEITRVTEGRFEVSRFIPSYYYYDRHYTAKYLGLLLTMSTSLTQFGYASKNTTTEVDRLASELREEMGPKTTLDLRLFIEIGYSDITGAPHLANFDITPEPRWVSPTTPEPIGFRLVAYSEYMNSGSSVPLFEMSRGATRLTGKYISENWENYPTKVDLIEKGEQFEKLRNDRKLK